MRDKILKPHAVSLGSSLAVMALSSPVKAEILEGGLEYIKASGFEPHTILNPSGDFGKHEHLFASDTASKRATALEQSFESKDISGIISVRGGYGSIALLPLINFNQFKNTPKLIVGFSDLTVLLLNIYKHSGLISVHGPSLITYGAKAKNNNLEAKTSLEVLIGLMTGKIVNPFEGMVFQKVSGGSEGSGRLIGGNLTMIQTLMGTPWEVDFSNHILFLEDVGEDPYKVHRALTQLRFGNKFKGVQGVLLGDFTYANQDKERAGPSYHDVFVDVFKDFNFPVLTGLPVGHGDLNYPVPIGVKARIIDNKLEMLETTVIQ